tara:strand:+ start:919418 stop:920455 length:1038 start_codon:yes stop_codon:yes gene_type:complete
MRRIGNLTDATLAQQFCDYLVTLSIEATADERIDGANNDSGKKSWDIWIREEKDVDQAREELAKFIEDPNDARYRASAEAARIREKKAADNARRLKNVVKKQRWSDASGTGGAVLAGAAVKQQGIPVTIGIIVLSIFCSFTSNFGRANVSSDPDSDRQTLEQRVFNGLSFVSWNDYIAGGRDSFASLRKGEVWRVVTPMFLHGDTMHLAFNMLMLYFLGSVIERLHGSIFVAVLVLVTHIAGMALQVLLPGAESMPAILSQLAGTPFAIGASGAVYGLFGFLLIRPALDSSYPIRMVPMNVALMLGWLFFCMLPIFDLKVANGAHLGGFIAGMAIAPLLSVGRSK